MAFETVRVRKVRKEDEESFLDWDGRATLFDEDEESEEPEDVETDEDEDPDAEDPDDEDAGGI